MAIIQYIDIIVTIAIGIIFIIFLFSVHFYPINLFNNLPTIDRFVYLSNNASILIVIISHASMFGISGSRKIPTIGIIPKKVNPHMRSPIKNIIVIPMWNISFISCINFFIYTKVQKINDNS